MPTHSPPPPPARAAPPSPPPPPPAARGASVFALSQSGASSAAARWMANKENQSDLVGGINAQRQAQDRYVQFTKLDMSITAQIKDSLQLGRVLLGEIGQRGQLHKPQVEQAGFAVLKAPDIPSVLVETAFISNPEEEKRLRSSAYQEQLANALMRGITRYFAKNPPLARSRSVCRSTSVAFCCGASPPDTHHPSMGRAARLR